MRPFSTIATLAAVGLALAACSAGARGATDPSAGTLKLERVVFPPTHDPRTPVDYAAQPWPKWPVDYGLLTPHGAVGVRLLAQADKSYFVGQGLLPANGCPPARAIVATASAKERAFKTGETYVDALAPGCGVSVARPAKEGPEDSLFHPLDSDMGFNGRLAHAQALALAPAAGMAAEAKAAAPVIALLQKTLGCCAAPACAASHLAAGCTLADMPTDLVEHDHDRAKLSGPLDIGSTASQTFLLEYLEGMPMTDVGWGRLTRDHIEILLRFHPIKFHYENGSLYVARRAGGPLMQKMLDALDAARGPALTLLFGHDTNIADLGSLLDLTWDVPSYPAGDVPPGGALGFELYRDTAGHKYVRAFFRAQTMDQLRNLTPLTGGDKAYRGYLPIPGCEHSTAAGCLLGRFDAIVKARMGGDDARAGNCHHSRRAG